MKASKDTVQLKIHVIANVAAELEGNLINVHSHIHSRQFHFLTLRLVYLRGHFVLISVLFRLPLHHRLVQ